MKVITIGRGAGNDIVINDAKISQNHVQIVEHDNGDYTVIDLNSTNGTYINDRRITGEKLVRPEDYLTIGETKMTIKSVFAKGIGVEAAVTTATQQQIISNIENPIGNNKSLGINNTTNNKNKKNRKLTQIILISIIAILSIIICGIGVYIIYDNYTEKLEEKAQQEQDSETEFINRINESIEKIEKKENEREREKLKNTINNNEKDNKKLKEENDNLKKEQQKADSLNRIAFDSIKKAQAKTEAKTKEILAETNKLKEKEDILKKEIQKAKNEAKTSQKALDDIRKSQEKLLLDMFYMKINGLNDEQKQELAKRLNLKINKEDELDKKIKNCFQKGDIKTKQNIISEINIINTSNNLTDNI